METLKSSVKLPSRLCVIPWKRSKGANKEIDCTHKRALRILYEDYESSFETLLARSGSNSIHTNVLQELMMAVYMSMNHLNPSHLYGNFMKRNPKYTI